MAEEGGGGEGEGMLVGGAVEVVGGGEEEECIGTEATTARSVSSNTSISQHFTRIPFIGPLTLEDSILSSKWKKKDSSNSLYSFDGPLPGLRPVDGSTQANDLFLSFFFW